MIFIKSFQLMNHLLLGTVDCPKAPNKGLMHAYNIGGDGVQADRERRHMTPAAMEGEAIFKI